MATASSSISRLQALCGPGAHDKPTTVGNLPPLLQLDSFFDGMPGADDGSAAETRGLVEVQLRKYLALHKSIPMTPMKNVGSDSQQQDTESYKKIGGGTCGSIFSRDSEALRGQEKKVLATKLSIRGNEDALENDHRMHDLIEWQFKKWDFTAVKIPECLFLVHRHEPNYLNEHPKLIKAADPVCYLPASALVTERIPPLPQATRCALISKFCEPRIRALARADEANADCLVQVYLGSMRGKGDTRFFSLRNFKMHLNQMIELQLDVVSMARRMAVAMAIMHWAAKTDARDVEFVLGSSWQKKTSSEASPAQSHTDTGPSSGAPKDSFHCTTNLWVLDFNQVRRITMDDEGVEMAISAVRLNAPYFPRPLQKLPIQKRTWNAFAASYIAASDIILREGSGEKLLILPRLFIRRLIELQRRREHW